MIQQSAVSINGEKMGDMTALINPLGEILVKVGKRRFCKVIFG